MVLKPDILAEAIDSLAQDSRPRLLMSPRASRFPRRACANWRRVRAFVIVCGRFEGVDQRVIDARQLEEVSSEITSCPAASLRR